MIRVQREDFDVGAELDRLARDNRRIGGIASFVGVVRDPGGGDRVTALRLEHYPGMTEKKLAEIEAEAHRRWPLDAVLIIHRYGRLEPGERIVLVATASPHRKAALGAALTGRPRAAGRKRPCGGPDRPGAAGGAPYTFSSRNCRTSARPALRI